MSRGQVVRKLAGKSSTSEVAVALNELPLNRLRPCRLGAIIPTEKSLTEWRWDLDRLTTRKHAWKSRHWFSSGLDEPRAERERDRVCKAARNQKFGGRLNWLRRLHRSHLPERGPFSIDPETPLTTIRETLIKHSERVKTALQLYKERRLPLAMFARFIGKDIHDTRHSVISLNKTLEFLT